MPIDVYWQDKANGVLRLNFSREWTIAEYDAAIQACRSLASQVSYRTAMLHDVPPDVKLPPNYISSMRRFATQSHGVKAHTIMVVTPNLFTRTILSVLMRLYRNDRLMTADSIEDGLQLCLKRAEKLRDISPNK